MQCILYCLYTYITQKVTTVIELILDITHVLLHQCVTKKDGWKTVEEVLSMVYACSIYFDDIIVLERKILYAVLDGLLEELRRYTLNYF